MHEVDTLLGVLVGDCLGAPYEFRTGPITGPIKVGPSVFGHPAGHGTDDTETTIAVARGLAATTAPDAALTNIADNLATWLASKPADVGGTTRAGLDRWNRTGDLYGGLASERSIANGALMRSAPFALLPSRVAVELAVASARLTHAHPVVLAGVAVYVELLQQLLAGRRIVIGDTLTVPDLTRAVAVDTLEQVPPPTGGYAPYALSLALWCATRAPDFNSGIDAVIRLGGDTDTNGAICVAVLAARHGIPATTTTRLAASRIDELTTTATNITTTWR